MISIPLSLMVLLISSVTTKLMKMYRVKSQTQDGYPDSHGYYQTKTDAQEVINELSNYYSNRNTKYWILEVN